MDNGVEPDAVHPLWGEYKRDLQSLKAQAHDLQQKQIARHIGVNSSTVGRRMSHPRPRTWEDLGPIIAAYIEHADAQGRVLAPAHFGDLGEWQRRLEQIRLPITARPAELPRPPGELAVPLVQPSWHSAELPAVLPGYIGCLLCVLFVLTSYTTLSSPRGSSPDRRITSSPSPVDSSKSIERDLDDRSEQQQPADRGTSRPPLPTPSASPPARSDPLAQGPDTPCDVQTRLLVLPSGFHLIVICPGTSLATWTCAPPPRRPIRDTPADSNSPFSCVVLLSRGNIQTS
ncbi:hypothetical protein [Streptomyces phaeochromogenes]|uniref:hypothetical protein n=1 Tax=Streptomyces phaeochromogenes TaxID=1923 RepID=UPI000A66AC18|nr:hypothetical protein [Streptomyces phaeochromogenes]